MAGERISLFADGRDISLAKIPIVGESSSGLSVHTR